jgi:hypothetical protein
MIKLKFLVGWMVDADGNEEKGGDNNHGIKYSWTNPPLQQEGPNTTYMYFSLAQM